MKKKSDGRAQIARRKLTPAERAFAHEYIINGGNATEAWLATHRRVKRSTAAVKGCQALKRPRIREYLDSLLESVHGPREAHVRRVLEELGAVAFFDPIDVYDGTGRLKRIQDIRPEARRALERIESTCTEVAGGVGEVVIERVRFKDKIRALELLGKHLGLFSEKVHCEGVMEVQVVTSGPRQPTDGPSSSADVAKALVTSAGGADVLRGD